MNKCVSMCIYCMHMCVCCMYLFNHSYVFGLGCNKYVLCSVVSSVGICWVILSYVVCIYVSFKIGLVCFTFTIGDSGGNINGVCRVMSLLVWCPSMGLMSVWYVLLCVLICLSPDVVVLDVGAGGDGVGSW